MMINPNSQTLLKVTDFEYWMSQLVRFRCKSMGTVFPSPVRKLRCTRCWFGDWFGSASLGIIEGNPSACHCSMFIFLVLSLIIFNLRQRLRGHLFNCQRVKGLYMKSIFQSEFQHLNMLSPEFATMVASGVMRIGTQIFHY